MTTKFICGADRAVSMCVCGCVLTVTFGRSYLWPR